MGQVFFVQPLTWVEQVVRSSLLFRRVVLLEGGQTEAVDEAQGDALNNAADETGDTDPAERSSMSGSAARPGGGEQ